jgi:hypothetical protein
VAADNGTGYGIFWDGKRYILAHRYSYELSGGCIEHKNGKRQVIDHLCRNSFCVRPDHLQSVTDRVNILRGLGAGETNQNAKLTKFDVIEIRAQHARGISKRALAREHGVAPGTIRRIIWGQGWACVPGGPSEPLVPVGQRTQPREKLTPRKVRAIRKAWAAAPVWGTLSKLARQHGVSYVSIRNVVQRVTWKHAS